MHIFQCGKKDQSVDCLGRRTTNLWHADKTADKVRNMSRPKTTKEMGSTLAIFNWLRPYIIPLLIIYFILSIPLIPSFILLKHIFILSLIS